MKTSHKMSNILISISDQKQNDTLNEYEELKFKYDILVEEHDYV